MDLSGLSGASTSAIAAGATALIGSVLAYVAGRRAKSGNVRHTDAEALWDDMRGQLKSLTARVTTLEADNDRLREQQLRLREQLLQKEEELGNMRLERTRDKFELEHLKAERVADLSLIHTLQAQVRELQEAPSNSAAPTATAVATAEA